MITMLWTRKQFLLTAFSGLATACAQPGFAGSRGVPTGAGRSLDGIEGTTGGRLGLYALDTGTGRDLSHRSDERFAMCSTFKWVLAAIVLARVDRGQLSLDEAVRFGPDDLLEYAPVTRKHVGEGAMTVAALAEASVTVSDNTAANLLLAKVGGPAGFTRFVRALGDTVTRLDRNEPTLNGNDPGDPRDTTSPRAMVGLMRSVLCGDALSPAGRGHLLGWMRKCETGKDRLRAGFPRGWVVGDKTGTGRRGAVNDVAIGVPPGRPPILVAAYLSDGNAEPAALAAAHAIIGGMVARELGATTPDDGVQRID